MKKSLLLILAVLILIPLGVVSAQNGETLVVALGSDSLTFDPLNYDEEVTNEVNLHIFETLVFNDTDLNSVPALAESWEQIEDTVWRFYLRQGVKFSNGNDFNADDVVYTITRAKTWEQSQYKGDTSAIKEAVKVDDYTVDLVTNFAYSILPANLKSLMMMDKESSENADPKDLAENPVGTGKYILVDYVREDHIDLVANPNYWGEKPEIQSVRFRPITNPATRTAALLSGEVDLAVDISSRDVEKVNSSNVATILQAPALRIIYLNIDGWSDQNKGVEPQDAFKDVRVRQAIYHAIDEETIIKNVMNGNAYIATGPIPTGYNGSASGVERYPYDPEKAMALLKEAGMENKITVTLDSPNDRYVNDGQIAEAVAGYLEKVGITVNLNLQPKSLFFDYVAVDKYNTSLSLGGWYDGTGEGAIILKSMFYSFGKKAGYGTGNRGHFSNEKFDELIDEALVTVDAEARAKLVEEAAVILNNEVGFIPLHYQQDIYGVNNRVTFEPMRNKHIYAWRFSFK
ncbi:MAG: ABC transporter substrate-binding protein [Chloroflexi bacterium]|nr:ABC transporter substrate-binding protein [Chloroflexota bacterium]